MVMNCPKIKFTMAIPTPEATAQIIAKICIPWSAVLPFRKILCVKFGQPHVLRMDIWLREESNKAKLPDMTRMRPHLLWNQYLSQPFLAVETYRPQLPISRPRPSLRGRTTVEIV